jgi:hypothetical protein
MTRDDVLKEYAYTKIDYDLMALEGEAYTAWHTDAMADEIVRWRTLDNERKARRAAREPIHSLYDILVQLSEENDDLIEERNRLRAILAMLKKPDIDVLASAMTAWSRTGEVPAMLHAAITTAEREVTNDEG